MDFLGGSDTATQLSTYEVSRSSLAPFVSQEVLGAEVGAQLFCATLAAVVSSLASQPGDALLSDVNCRGRAVGGTPGGSILSSDATDDCVLGDEEFGLLEAVRRLGVAGLFRGTQARLVQMLLIVVVQLLVNDSIRAAVGLGTMGI